MAATSYRLLRWLWKPFQLCIARVRKRGIDTKNDLVDVFATFFLLSYHKCLYQTLMYYGTITFIVNIDPSGKHSSIYKGSIDGSYTTTYTGFLISTLCVSAFFCLLPPILLTCYPFRFFRSCLSKCHLDTISINIFVENFHGYYRNSLDGGRDMRSLSGFYFFLSIGICSVPLFSFYIIKDYSFRNSGVIIFIVALILASIRPYKKTCANILDTLILTDLSLLYLYSDYLYNDGSSLSIRSLLPRSLIFAPVAIFIVLLLFRMGYKIFRIILCNIKGSPCYQHQCCSRTASHEEMDESSALIATSIRAGKRSLIDNS